MYVHLSEGCVRIGCAAVMATALTVAVAPPKPEGIQGTPVASHSVQLQALAISAFTNSAEAAGAITPDPQSIDVRTAAAVGGGDVLGNLVRGVVAFASIAALPLYYIAAPITFPIAFLVANASVPEGIKTGFMAPYGQLAVILGVLFGPVALAATLLNQVYSSTPAAAAAAEIPAAPARSAASQPVATDQGDAEAPRQSQASAPADAAQNQADPSNSEVGLATSRNQSVREPIANPVNDAPASRATNRLSRAAAVLQSPGRSKTTPAVGAASATAQHSASTDGGAKQPAAKQPGQEREHRGDVKRSAR